MTEGGIDKSRPTLNPEQRPDEESSAGEEAEKENDKKLDPETEARLAEEKRISDLKEGKKPAYKPEFLKLDNPTPFESARHFLRWRKNAIKAIEEFVKKHGDVHMDHSIALSIPNAIYETLGVTDNEGRVLGKKANGLTLKEIRDNAKQKIEIESGPDIEILALPNIKERFKKGSPLESANGEKFSTKFSRWDSIDPDVFTQSTWKQVVKDLRSGNSDTLLQLWSFYRRGKEFDAHNINWEDRVQSKEAVLYSVTMPIFIDLVSSEDRRKKEYLTSIGFKPDDFDHFRTAFLQKHAFDKNRKKRVREYFGGELDSKAKEVLLNQFAYLCAAYTGDNTAFKEIKGYVPDDSMGKYGTPETLSMLDAMSGDDIFAKIAWKFVNGKFVRKEEKESITGLVTMPTKYTAQGYFGGLWSEIDKIDTPDLPRGFDEFLREQLPEQDVTSKNFFKQSKDVQSSIWVIYFHKMMRVFEDKDLKDDYERRMSQAA